MAQQQPHNAEGYFGKGEDAHTGPAVSQTVYPKDAGVTASSENERTGAPLQAVGTGNSVLERDAQSKGHSFEYLKTKQFWLTLLLGQGSYFLPLAMLDACMYDVNIIYSPGCLHRQHQHALLAPRQRRHLDPRLPILLQLRPA